MNNEILIKDNVFKLFCRFCIPSVLGMLGISLYILADTFFVANGVGEKGLAALNIVLPIYSLISAIGLMIGIGAAAYSTLEKSKGNKEISNKVYSFAIVVGVAFGIIILVIGLVIPEKIVGLLGSSEELAPLGIEYIKVIMCFAPMFILNNIFLAFVRNDGKPKLAMISMIAGSLFNVVMDYVAIYVLGLGMFGAALATAFSPVIGICIMSTYLLSKRSSYKFKVEKMNHKFIKHIISGGGASFVGEISPGIVMFIFNQVILALKGDVGVAAYGIVANVALIVNGIFTGMAQGIQPIISANYGAGKLDRIRKVLRFGIITSLIIGFIAYTGGIIFDEQITAMFNGGNNLELANITVEGIRIYFIAFIFMGINLVIAAMFQSVLEMKFSAIISIGRGLIFTNICVLFLSKVMGINGVWISPVISEMLTLIIALVFAIRWFKYNDKVELIKIN